MGWGFARKIRKQVKRTARSVKKEVKRSAKKVEKEASRAESTLRHNPELGLLAGPLGMGYYAARSVRDATKVDIPEMPEPISQAKKKQTNVNVMGSRRGRAGSGGLGSLRIAGGGRGRQAGLGIPK